ncbi:MAG: DEAD/DEAH box helicase [Phycisphaerae bacterium]
MPTRTVKRSRNVRKPSPRAAKISHIRKPKDMSLGEWQLELRRQSGREQTMRIRNLGRDPVFSEFAVTNPVTRRTYRVVIRGDEPGVNFCSCPDYAVNTLGTCKHIEATLRRLRRRHATALRKGHIPPFAEVYVRYGTQRTIIFSPGADCLPRLQMLANQYFNVDGSLKPIGFARFDRFLREAVQLDHDLRIYDDTMALAAEVRDGQSRRTRLQKRYGGKGNGAPWNRLLKVPLYPYQREGTLFAAQAGRAIIADEMGLGKTIEAIAAAEILACEYGLERVLIVCPASLKSQWHQEIAQFASRPAVIIEGLTHQRKALYEQDGGFFKIVNYDVVHRDLAAIREWSPELVILDEAQRIKNWQTRTAKSVKRIESPYSLVLTGTPLENRLEELHSIVEFIDRYRLGPLFAFKAAHEIQEEDSTKVIGYRDLNRIHKTLEPILIRRTKKEVLDQLPPRMDKNFFVPMTKQQWVPHEENREIVARIVAKWRRYKFLSEADQLRLRIALQYMRMACDSTYLIDHETKHHTKVDELATLLGEIFEESGSKVVIFSQWLRMNELVADMLEIRRWGHVHLHGGVPSRERKHLTRALREDKDCRVFLSTDAGGVGLNLQTASTVINMDLPWNPAVLEQRIGRVHRLGQKRPVRVVNFVSEGTIEHGMLSLLKFKRSMFAGVLDGATDKVLMGDSALNRFIKTVDKVATSIPHISPTPSEKEEADRATTTPAPTDGRSSADGESPGAGIPAALDVQALGQLLTKGAEFLQNLGRTLAEPCGATDGLSASASAASEGEHTGRQAARGTQRGQGFRPRIEADSATGRPELRIALPDDHTLQQWAGLVSNVLGTLQGRK